MTYKRIQPFPDPQLFSFPELRALTSVWQEKKTALEDNGAYKEFIKGESKGPGSNISLSNK